MPVMFTATTLSQSSTETSTAGRRIAIPALLMRMSTRPSPAAPAPTSAPTAAAHGTSAARVDMDLIGRAGPYTTRRIHAETIERAGSAVRENFAAGNFRACDGELPDVLRAVLLVARAGVGDIEEFLVGRKTDAVRPDHVGDDGLDRGRLGVPAIDVAAADLLGRLVPLIVGVQG